MKPILRQNKKTVLIKFLFPNSLASELEVSNHSEDQIENIKNFNEVHSLKERITILVSRLASLENQRNLNLLSDASKIAQKVLFKTEQEESYLKEYSDPSDQNRNPSNISFQEVEGMESDNLSERHKTSLEAFPSTE